MPDALLCSDPFHKLQKTATPYQTAINVPRLVLLLVYTLRILPPCSPPGTVPETPMLLVVYESCLPVPRRVLLMLLVLYKSYLRVVRLVPTVIGILDKILVISPYSPPGTAPGNVVL